MTYPAILSLLTIVVGIFLMVFIVPTFMDAFEEMNLDMPLITVIVVGISNWLIQFWLLVVLALTVIAISLHFFYKNNKEFHYAVNVFLLRMPIFGQTFTKGCYRQDDKNLGYII